MLIVIFCLVFDSPLYVFIVGLRSAYNDDLLNVKSAVSGGELYTTWKARRYTSNGYEKVTKRYSDYIFYSPFRKVNFPAGITVPIGKF